MVHVRHFVLSNAMIERILIMNATLLNNVETASIYQIRHFFIYYTLRKS